MKYIFEYASPLGKIFIESDGDFLTGLWFEYSFDEKKYEENSDCEIKKVSADSSDLPSVISETCRWLDIYFSGREPGFTPEFKIENLTPFRKLVVDEMLKIPFGATTTYGDIAKNIAAKKGLGKMSAQAVGGAVGWNPLCIVVPCHRVLGTDGKLTGYGGGIRNKIALLKIEGIDAEKFTLPKSRKFM
ncbi:methylated-DNA--[protein]-cysteine S-methyltransferase [uncultured Treponema sp.]|uniref:methylated-DNA--[protein]-cysteine S-methyltransferase n=1 Tax=uncultured Treponema sp. TaxID=162155 RepID=UPI0025FB451A|nr:methylated-DNA--[protein]-cysteine S-methyltransferase [uncultured Treponema sp.]